MIRPKILLIDMPIDSIQRPSLGLSLLKSSLKSRNIDCTVLYLNIAFAEFIGFENYTRFHQINQYTLVGEWLFSRSCFGNFPGRDSYLEQYLRRFINKDQFEELKKFLITLEQSAQIFIDTCTERYQLKDYYIIGFGSKYNQNVSSLALSKRIKSVAPHHYIVFGGANWEGEMGKAYLRESPWVDYAVSGEADYSFPELVEGLLDGRKESPVPGIFCQNDSSSEESQIVLKLDDLPFPEYDDYVMQLGASSFSGKIKPKYAVETSRGCWWGEKSHCTFCGLNSLTMEFRSKSPERAYQEIKYIFNNYGREIEAVDNILDYKYVQTLLPKLRESKIDIDLLYEVKANLNIDTISLLAEAGVRSVAIGIESFSNPILEHMKKGTTDIQNIEVIKLCQDHGLRVYWNILYRFPGDDWDEYEKMIELIPSIWHLQPPTNVVPVSLDRFSAYHNNPGQYGISGIKPKAAYPFVYPYDQETLMKTVYHFDFEMNRSVGNYAPFVKAMREWQNKKPGQTLIAVRRRNSLVVHDTRPVAVDRETVLTPNQSILYEYCMVMRHWRSIEKQVGTMDNFEIGAASAFLDEMIDRRLVYRSGNYFLSLGFSNKI